MHEELRSESIIEGDEEIMGVVEEVFYDVMSYGSGSLREVGGNQQGYRLGR